MTAKKVIELIRVSTAAQAGDDRASIPSQHAVNRRTCEFYGLQIVRSIVIIDVSGTQVSNTPEMQELLRLIRDPEIHGVVAREFSRLMRADGFADLNILQHFIETRTQLYLGEGPIDLTSKWGPLVGGMRALFANVERTEMLERIASAKEAKRRRGELAQSPVVLPFGVGYKDGRFFYKPEAELVRQAFTQVLSGEQNYTKLAKLLGVTPRGMHLILRNRIWIGWRVIDKKRDTSTAGRYTKKNGKQADRRKIARSADEVIRVKVIEKPLITEKQFEAVQRLMDCKQSRHWRSRGLERRFTYHGFLTCSVCGEVVHTCWSRRDYYVCKGSRLKHTCDTKYMPREKLEATLDLLFSQRLTDPAFLEKCIAGLKRRAASSETQGTFQRLQSEVDRQEAMRQRVLEAFYDGTISKPERDGKLLKINAALRTAGEFLARSEPAPAALDSARLVQLLAPLAEWRYWSREQKRAVLATLLVDIRVANGEVETLGLSPSLFSNEDTRMGRDSSPLPA
jgi:DNA invertase Pin-like site-specific DNA recombinase